MAELLSGLIIGMIFGFVIKRSRFCLTGLIRDIALEGRRYNFIPILSIISVEGFLYFLFAQLGLLRLQTFFPGFSMIAVGLGSFIFGIGAVMSNGCLTSTLVKCGDGRLVGWISLTGFILSAYAVSATKWGQLLSKQMTRIAIVQDALLGRRTAMPLILFGALSVITFLCMIRHYRTHKPKYSLPARYSGVRHWFAEKIWPVEIAAPVIGMILGIGFAVSAAFGRQYGFAIAMPVLSWVFELTHPAHVVGGCNTYDQHIGWGSTLVLGIVIGVALTTRLSGELSLVRPTKKTALLAFLGSLLMGAGAMWGMGCLLGNGLVGTAQLSAKSWYAFLFLVLGIWAGTEIFLKKRSL